MSFAWFDKFVYDLVITFLHFQSLLQILPSPKTTSYRNKCEFTVGRDVDGDVRVGFVSGRFAANEHFVIPVDTCDNISEHMKRIVKAFEKMVVESGQPVRCFLQYLPSFSFFFLQ